MSMEKKAYSPKPEWLRVKSPLGEDSLRVARLLRDLKLNTVCEEANCPTGAVLRQAHRDVSDPGGQRHAKLHVLHGRQATPCAVARTSPAAWRKPSGRGPQARRDHSVTRDDLPDGAPGIGPRDPPPAGRIPGRCAVVRACWSPDIQGIGTRGGGDRGRADVLNHNIETVPRLYPEGRPMAATGARWS